MAKKFNSPTAGQLRRILVITWRGVIVEAMIRASVNVGAVLTTAGVEQGSGGHVADGDRSGTIEKLPPNDGSVGAATMPIQ